MARRGRHGSVVRKTLVYVQSATVAGRIAVKEGRWSDLSLAVSGASGEQDIENDAEQKKPEHYTQTVLAKSLISVTKSFTIRPLQSNEPVCRLLHRA
jgi:hypothetical protein